MASRAQHYREAERLLNEAEEPGDYESAIVLIGKAEVHAILAGVDDEVEHVAAVMDLAYPQGLNEAHEARFGGIDAGS